MTHANRGWICECGKRVFGNGGKSSHQRSCRVWAEHQLPHVERMLAHYVPGGDLAHVSIAAEFRAKYEAQRDALRARLGLS